MALPRRPSRTGRSRLTLLILVLTSVTVLTLDFRGAGAVDSVRSFAADVFAPVADAGQAVTRPVSNAWNGIFSYDDLVDENRRLEERIAELEGDQARAEDAITQYEELAELDDLQLTSSIPTVTATVVGGALTNFSSGIQLDRGTDAGIQVGMPVVDGAGLVGRVREVSRTRSIVQLITDPGFEFSARLAATGDIGIAHGTGEGGPIVLDQGVEISVDVTRGEVVSTGTYERAIFPPDIPIGVVSGVEAAADQLQQIVEVDVLADLADLSRVRVLLWEPS